MSHHHKRKRNRNRDRDQEQPEIPMTPMIDVVFLLLIYFVMTLEPTDIFAHLNVYTPSTDAPPKEQKDPPSLIRIGIYPDGIAFDDVQVTVTQLEGFMSRLAAASTTQSVLITCSVDSVHGNLVEVLNLCAKYNLTNLSVVSAE